VGTASADRVSAAPLHDILRRRIAAEGPITVAAYMADCLLHPEHGYYRSQQAIGRQGDFTTAPEISQMFGELLGLWAADCWQKLGAPPRCYLLELGPGRGTLMRDALRASHALPGFRAAVTPVLVEASARMRAQQETLLAGERAVWFEQLAGVPTDAPIILLANEFLDALPVRQFQRGADNAWHERCVGLDDDGSFRFMLDPRALPFDDLLPAVLREAPPGALLESSPPVRAVAVETAARLKHQGGVGLFIDYGYAKPDFGETLQAVYRHAYANPLENPGLADLTAHVDFASFALAATRAGARAHGPVGQGEFLTRLGIAARSARLKQDNQPQSGDIDRALHRLTAPEAMGTLFKVVALGAPDSFVPAGFA
jgi:NADH dehydrogenase [ubiquinone] 1 alpha subcomplex assembly factor 7